MDERKHLLSVLIIEYSMNRHSPDRYVILPHVIPFPPLPGEGGGGVYKTSDGAG